MSNEIENDVRKLRDRKSSFETKLHNFISNEMDGFRKDTGYSINHVDISLVDRTTFNSSNSIYHLHSVKSTMDIDI